MTVPSVSLGDPRSWRRVPLNGTGPARAGGAQCIVEADTAREPQHPSSARSLVAVPVERHDPPAAVAAAFLDPRRCRRDPASATERIHSGTALRAHGSTSIPWPSCRSDASTPSAMLGPPAPLFDFSRTFILLLRPVVQPGPQRTQGTTPYRRRPDQNAKPRTRWGASRMGVTRCHAVTAEQGGPPVGSSPVPKGFDGSEHRRRRGPRAASLPASASSNGCRLFPGKSSGLSRC